MPKNKKRNRDVRKWRNTRRQHKKIREITGKCKPKRTKKLVDETNNVIIQKEKIKRTWENLKKKKIEKFPGLLVLYWSPPLVADGEMPVRYRWYRRNETH